jgi:hypothetical protein
MEIVWARFGQKLFGSDLKAAVSMFAKNSNCSTARPVYQAPPTVEKDLVYHRRGRLETQFYFVSIGDADILRHESGEARFIRAFDGDIKPDSYSLSLYAQPANAHNFGMLFGRFGTYTTPEGEKEEVAYGFNDPKNPFKHLVIKSSNVNNFKPLYVKARNRFVDWNNLPEIINFVIEIEFGTSGIILRTRRVTEEEFPPCLQGISL